MKISDTEHQARLGRMRRAADYPFTLYVINPINRRLVRPLTRLGASPTAVTWVSFALALVAAAALFYAVQRHSWAVWSAPILVFISHVCDCLDGDLARYSGRLSTFGGALDPILDRVGEVAYVLAVVAGLHQVDPTAAHGVWGCLCLGGVLTYYFTTDAHVARLLKAQANDARRYGVMLGAPDKTRIKLGLYEPFMYGLALAVSAGFGAQALVFFAAAFWLGWVGQVYKIHTIVRRNPQ